VHFISTTFLGTLFMHHATLCHKMPHFFGLEPHLWLSSVQSSDGFLLAQALGLFAVAIAAFGDF
jgi:hypothetical protein